MGTAARPDSPLSRYRSKRDFRITPEPGPDPETGAEPSPPARRSSSARRRKPGTEALSFVIQKHWASHLHYDFRLELDGVLLSWAVPKGPSYDPKQRRMAIQVEDHPLAYGGFEGTIPAKQYGAGEVIVWDNGTWVPEGDPKAGLRDGKLVFRLHGQKLAGLWQLVRTSRVGEPRAQWLLIKKHDGWERSHLDYDVTAALPDSVVAQPLGRVEDREPRTAKDAEAVKGSTPATAPPAKVTRTASKSTRGDSSKQRPVSTDTGIASPPDLSGARKARLPAKMAPQLATLVSATPPGEWVAEAKFDGYRLMTRIEKGRASLMTRGGNDWTSRMPSLARALEALGLDNAWLDGEVVVMREDGSPDFNRLQQALGKTRGSGASERDILYFLFDLPHLNGYDLREVPLRDRRAVLRALLDGHGHEARDHREPRVPDDDERLRFSEDFAVPPEDMLAAACQMRLEGLILKRPDAPYVSARSDSWVKLKCQRRQEFVVIGFTDRSDGSKGLGSLLLGYYGTDDGRHDADHADTPDDADDADDGSGDRSGAARQSGHQATPGKGAQNGRRGSGTSALSLRYAGRVGTGWSLSAGASLRRQLEAQLVAHAPVDTHEIQRSHWMRRPSGDERWVKPTMVVEVAFAEWTPDGHVRHASFQGVRDDKPARAIRREATTAPEAISAAPAKRESEHPSTTARSTRSTHSTHSTHSTDAPGAPGATGVTSATRTSAKPSRASKAVAAMPSDRSTLQITHPERVIDPSTGLTKIDLVRYYASVADWLMPHLARRPVAVVRAPEGVDGQQFFQKHVDGDELIVIRDAAAVLQFTQLNAVEFHTWNAQADKLDRPDRIIFDLDPGTGVSWAQVRESALLVRALLRELGLESWLKTSGGKGLHVVVPLMRRHDHATCKAFSQAVVQHLAVTLPKRFSAKSGPRNRVGKVFADYLRNGEGQTTAAAFSARARPGLGVSMPIHWDQLDEVKRGDQWTIADARDHLSLRREDPWKAYWQHHQTLTAAIKLLAS
ncbi:non-homologous end-joining DNA ligase [Roseateles amylovorans]|uniref:DNA ligase (ATP) n=1 Tax=Roseateles amylovorans TaxID=2978473 RepID=A0ABY6B6Z2_9BURK|nr:non-homologous end-joining DNA ligase [Roseateles amylovorans]UXH80265.1 non-homologous end-joining DNA ligase [Roseateles amylovorans]